jgi:hypothetical protein
MGTETVRECRCVSGIEPPSTALIGKVLARALCVLAKPQSALSVDGTTMWDVRSHHAPDKRRTIM